MKLRREKWGFREYITTAALIGSAGALAIAGYTSSGSFAAPNPSPRPVAAGSAGPYKGCLELSATLEDATPSGTTYELGLTGLWGTGVDVVGERFTFVRTSPDPRGPDARIETPVIGIDQGVLTSILHEFAPVATTERIRVDGTIITEGGHELTGPQCDHTITLEPAFGSGDSDLPMAPLAFEQAVTRWGASIQITSLAGRRFTCVELF